MKKRIIILATVAAILLTLSILHPIVIVDTNKLTNKKTKSVFNPLGNINSKDCSMYIIFSNDDLVELPKSIRSHKVIYTNDTKLIEKIKRNFRFKCTGGDMTTCESILLIYSQGTLIFKSNIVIDKQGIGLQGNFGWAEAIDVEPLLTNLKDLEPRYLPIQYFN